MYNKYVTIIISLNHALSYNSLFFQLKLWPEYEKIEQEKASRNIECGPAQTQLEEGMIKLSLTTVNQVTLI